MSYKTDHKPRVYRPMKDMEFYYDRMLVERPEELKDIVQRYKNEDVILFDTFIDRIYNSGYANDQTITTMESWMYSAEFYSNQKREK